MRRWSRYLSLVTLVLNGGRSGEVVGVVVVAAVVVAVAVVAAAAVSIVISTGSTYHVVGEGGEDEDRESNGIGGIAEEDILS